MDDVERFETLFQEAYPRLRRYAHHRGLTAADAEDLLGEVFLVAWRRLDVVPRDDPVPWLFAVARNVARNQRRSQWRRERLLQRLPPPDAVPDIDIDLDNGDTTRAVHAALDRLTSGDRELLVLHAWDELTPTQIAVVLSCSNGAARVRLHRARDRFADHLRAVEDEHRVTPVASPTGQHETTSLEGPHNVQA